MASLVNHTKPLKKNKYQFFTKSSKNIEEEGTLSNSFYEVKTDTKSRLRKENCKMYKKRKL